jgi:hypothetical protein
MIPRINRINPRPMEIGGYKKWKLVVRKKSRREMSSDVMGALLGVVKIK